MRKEIARGAEAIIFFENGVLVKERIKKSYRHPDLDIMLRKRRTRAEARLLKKASKLCNVPKVFAVDEKNFRIAMEFLRGRLVADILDDMPKKEAEKLCEQIGRAVASLHDANIIHGDLTTSNMILTKKYQLYIFDFGLGFCSNRIEDKAVDLHLLKQAMESKHYERWQKYFDAVLRGYKSNSRSAVLKQLKKVEVRGRYKRKAKSGLPTCTHLYKSSVVA